MFGRILKGEKPANLPIQQATKIINLKTAKSLGITEPQSVQSRADEILAAVISTTAGQSDPQVSNGHVRGAGRAESYSTSFRLCFAGAYAQPWSRRSR